MKVINDSAAEYEPSIVLRAILMVVFLGGLGFAAWQYLPVLSAFAEWFVTPGGSFSGEAELFFNLVVPPFVQTAPKAFPGLFIGGIAACLFAATINDPTD